MLAPSGVFAGLCTLDVVHHVAVAPGPDGKVTASRQDVAAGGPATGAAIAFAALGGAATLVSVLGSGPLTALIRSDLADLAGLRLLDAGAPPDFVLPVSSVRVSPAGRSVSSPDAAFASADVMAPAAALAAVATAGVALVDGHHSGVALSIARAAAAAGVPLLVDLGRPKPIFEALLPLADVVVASADWAGRLAEILAAGPSAVAVTAGPGPIAWLTTSGHGSVRVAPVEAVDTLGAGDVFHGALAFALARGGTAHVVARWPAVLGFAAAVAAVRVASLGPHTWRDDRRLKELTDA